MAPPSPHAHTGFAPACNPRLGQAREDDISEEDMEDTLTDLEKHKELQVRATLDVRSGRAAVSHAGCVARHRCK